jgi:hypothetical protein
MNAQIMAYNGLIPRYISTKMLPQKEKQNKQLNGLKLRYLSVSLLYGSNINNPTNRSAVARILRALS